MLIQCMDWNIATSQSCIAESEPAELQQKAVDLLDLLQKKPALTKHAKRESGILRRHTAFYTKSVRLCCEATQITLLAKPQRFIFV